MNQYGNPALDKARAGVFLLPRKEEMELMATANSNPARDTEYNDMLVDLRTLLSEAEYLVQQLRPGVTLDGDIETALIRRRQNEENIGHIILTILRAEHTLKIYHAVNYHIGYQQFHISDFEIEDEQS